MNKKHSLKCCINLTDLKIAKSYLHENIIENMLGTIVGARFQNKCGEIGICQTYTRHI